jgi:LysM repeat protein
MAMLTVSCSKTRTPDRIEVLYAQPVVDEYEVLPGDTVKKIAEKFGMDPEHLVAINNLAPPYKISIGESLKVDNQDSDMIVVKQIFYS